MRAHGISSKGGLHRRRRREDTQAEEGRGGEGRGERRGRGGEEGERRRERGGWGAGRSAGTHYDAGCTA
jgi:hypothetical protein